MQPLISAEFLLCVLLLIEPCTLHMELPFDPKRRKGTDLFWAWFEDKMPPRAIVLSFQDGGEYVVLCWRVEAGLGHGVMQCLHSLDIPSLIVLRPFSGTKAGKASCGPHPPFRNQAQSDPGTAKVYSTPVISKKATLGKYVGNDCAVVVSNFSAVLLKGKQTVCELKHWLIRIWRVNCSSSYICHPHSLDFTMEGNINVMPHCIFP